MKISTDLTFNADTKSQDIVIFDFWATWCGPCQKYLPIFEQAEKELGDKAAFFKIEADLNHESVKQCLVRSIPATVIFKAGKIEKTLVGIQTVEVLRREIAALEVI